MAKTIKLDKPVAWHGEMIAEIRLKEPSGLKFIELGEPRTVVWTSAGNGFYVEQPPIIRAYLDACIDHEGGGMLLAQMSLNDAKAIKDALFDFFRAAPQETTGGQPGTSSSI